MIKLLTNNHMNSCLTIMNIPYKRNRSYIILNDYKSLKLNEFKQQLSYSHAIQFINDLVFQIKCIQKTDFCLISQDIVYTNNTFLIIKFDRDDVEINGIYRNIAYLTLESMGCTLKDLENTKLYYTLERCIQYNKFIYV